MARVAVGPVSRWVADTLIRRRWILLAVAVLLAPLAFYFSWQLDFDRSIESMFAKDDPVLEPYQRLRDRFGGNEIVLAVYEDKDLLAEDGSGIKRLAEVTKQIKQIKGVQGILSLAEVNQALRQLESFGGLSNFQFLSNPGRKADPFPIVNRKSELAADFREMFEGYTHSTDGTTVSIACILEPRDKNQVSRRALIEDLRRVIGDKPNGQLTGEPAMVSDGFTYVKKDGERLGINCVILLSIVIILCFRSIRWVLIPLAIMQLTLWLTRGLLVVLGVQLSMVSSMLTAIVTVIAVATSMHVILRYREARTVGKDQVASLHSAIALLFWPIFWSCLTDAAGFASLMIASVGPIQDFGLMMAIASIMVLFCILLLVSPLGLLGKLDADPKRAWGESRMRSVLRSTTALIASKPAKLAILIGIVAVFVSIGNFFLQVETDFTKNFRADTPIAISYNYVEKRMGGAGVIDVVLPAPVRLNEDYLEKVQQFQDELRQLEFPGQLKNETETDGKILTKVISLADVDAAARKAKGVGSQSLLLRLEGMKLVMPTLFASLYSTEADDQKNRFYRVMLRTSQRHSSTQKQWLLAQVQQLAEKHFANQSKTASPETTGFYVLLSRLVHSILRDQYWTFGIAIVAISLVMLIAFRSFKLAAIALVPNLLPILMVMGTLGWLGIRMNMGAAMIAAVSLGLSIDSSIHYLWSFQRWRESGLSVAESVVEAQLRVGRAVVFSTLALVIGFSSLCFSQFVPTIYFGALVGATMLGGLFGNLVVLPILLHLSYRENKIGETGSASLVEGVGSDP